MPLSSLELGRVRQGGDRRTALDEARRLAQHAEVWGYRRIWVAEHHNMPTVATAATSLVIAHLAAGTRTIRVGAGGIMLPNHAPYVIAEQFGTLETLFPGRIDLGLGRAPGTDQLTLRALRRDAANSDHFPDDVQELQAFLAPVQEGQRIEAVPGSGTNVPLWILGSSLFGAQLAGELGLPFGFASHFAPQMLDTALKVYRQRFRPSAQLSAPYAVVGVNVIAATEDDEARGLATSQQMSFTDMVRGARRLIQPPIADIETYWSGPEKLHVTQMLACSVVGGPETVRAGLRDLVERTQADELMVVSDLFDPALRLRSFEIIAGAAGIRPELVATGSAESESHAPAAVPAAR
ncbi:MAG: LLM class flavin-dependent oxidoreductase [Vicinamibacterales bacterium]